MMLLRICLVLTLSFLVSGEYVYHDNQCNTTNNDYYELEALMSIYYDMGGLNWYINSNWTDTSISYCNWVGILCDKTCRVIEIEMIANNMSGIIPSNIGYLGGLSILNLVCNYITGGLDHLPELRNLTYLDLTYNKIQGTLPSDIG